MLSETDAFPDTTPADQRHTQVVIGDHFSDIDEDEQEDEATSRSLDMGKDGEAQPRTDGVSVAHGMCDDTAAHMTADVAAPVVGTDDVLSATDPHRDTRAGSYSAPRLSIATPPMANLHRRPHPPPHTWPLLSPLIWLGTPMIAPLRLRIASAATDTGMDVGTDPNPATSGLFADEHIFSFLLRIRRRADDKLAGLVLDAAPPDTGAGVAANPAPGSWCRRPCDRRWPHHRHGCRHCRWFTYWCCRL